MKLQTLEELAKTDLEYTAFYVGFLTDFFGTPAHKTYMSPMVSVLDLAHDTAAIPGSGNTPVVFTHTFDMAKFVARALDLPKWDREYYIVGDKATWSELLEVAEQAKGKPITRHFPQSTLTYLPYLGKKFKVIFDSIEDLQKGIVTELPALTKALPYIPVPREALLAFSAAFGLIFEYGETNFDESTALNQKFPDIETLKIKTAIRDSIRATS